MAHQRRQERGDLARGFLAVHIAGGYPVRHQHAQVIRREWRGEKHSFGVLVAPQQVSEIMDRRHGGGEKNSGFASLQRDLQQIGRIQAKELQFDSRVLLGQEYGVVFVEELRNLEETTDIEVELQQFVAIGGSYNFV